MTLIADKKKEDPRVDTQGLLNVLVVDDTVVYRRIVGDVVNGLAGVTLAGTASNGCIALEKMKHLAVDVVLLDIEMPVMDGLATLAVLRRDYPDVRAIMVSGANKHSADVTVKALAGGALDFVPKPECSDPQASRDNLAARLEPLLRLAASRRGLRPSRASDQPPAQSTHIAAAPEISDAQPPSVVRTAPKPTRIDVVTIGISTGGPDALAQLVPQLPGDLGVPILLVQHMPPVFTQSLAQSLNKKSALSVREAVDAEPIEPNTLLIAPGGRHMVVRSHLNAATGQRSIVVGLNDSPPENNCRPAVDTLFRSVAAHYGANVLSVVMTGMGTDGCEGVRTMRRKGCLCLTQGEASCVVYGMPRAVDEAGLSDERVALKDLPSRITALVRRSTS